MAKNSPDFLGRVLGVAPTPATPAYFCDSRHVFLSFHLTFLGTPSLFFVVL